MPSIRTVVLPAFLTAASWLVPGPSLAAGPIDYTTARLERRLVAVRTTTPIVLDGRLDEAVWQTAPPAKDFVQNDPREGEPATFDTEVRMLYDGEHLYIGVFARDDDPSAIIVNELKKDFNTGSSDTFQVVLDTFHDARNGYQFAVNPMGARWDAQMANEGRENNADWDGVWDVATRIAEDGWYAEIRIPFKTLKFSPADDQVWGVNFQRRLRRMNENSHWAPLRRIHQVSRVSMAGTLEGLHGIRPGSNLRIKPYASASAGQAGAGARATGDADGGIDVKYGVTSGLTWDFTVNTDFSQVEADEQQVNLTRFSLFFPEKRDFFLENSGVFQFGSGSQRGGGANGGRQNSSQDMILFFSRQIGLSASGDAIPILGGTRLTGRAGAYSIGALNIQQRALKDSASTNFSALRLRRDILASSDVGVMFLDKDRSGPGYNRALGADANFRFFGDLTFNFAAARTYSPDDVLARIEASGTKRPSELYTKSAVAYRDAFWELRGSYQTIGHAFNDEMGFVPRFGVNNAEVYVGTHIRPRFASSWLRETFPHIQVETFSGQRGGGLESRYTDWHWPITLQNSTFIEVGTNPNVEVIAEPFTINTRRGISILPGRYEFKEHFILANSNSAARVSTNLRLSTGDFYDGYRRGYNVGLTVRASERLNLSGNVQFNDISLPQGAFTTTLLTGRVNVNFTTRMFLNALLQYNTDARQWSSNVRFNFLHHPLSDFFLVYNERHDTRSGDLINRALIAKLTYLFAF
ncbi:MAG: DUF5916 domain-containing protein [Vicinamibacterales bacterium]